jgi:hypothetical protein
VVLLGAWTAWRAVQQQISSDRERALADREEVERLLSEDLTEYAEGMAVAWSQLEALEKDAEQVRPQAVFDATSFMAEQLSRPEVIATHRAMVEILGWDRRRRYMRLLHGLEELKPFIDPKSVQNDPDEVLSVIRRLANEFESCLPNTSHYFEGLWRRSPKARTFADWVE